MATSSSIAATNHPGSFVVVSESSLSLVLVVSEMARELGIGCLNGKKKIVFDGTVLIREMKGQGREKRHILST